MPVARRSAPYLAAVLLSCAPALEPSPAAPSPALVRVATWNVHDLFDAEDRLAPPGELDAVLAPEELEAKLVAVAAVLAGIDADVVLLQEVENQAVLDALASRAGYAAARLVDGPDPRGIDVAALSRLPVLAYVSHAADRDPTGGPLWPRDCTELHLAAAGGRRLVAVGTHLSSAVSDDGTRRERQAARLRQLADALVARGARVVAGGDLNDDADAPALAPLLGDGAWVDPAAALPDAERWTWSSGSRRAALDRLVVPRGDAAAILSAVVVGGDEVSAASDHRPVVLDLWVD